MDDILPGCVIVKNSNDFSAARSHGHAVLFMSRHTIMQKCLIGHDTAQYIANKL